MDPEPGRCRRTDGYKWRCRKDVLPNTKYCERHIHRGRSRKHVEISKITLQHTPTKTYPSSDTPTITYSRKTSQKINSHNRDDTSDKFPTPGHGNQQNKIPSLSESKVLTCTATAITNSANGKSKTHSMNVENDKSSRSRENGDDLNDMVADSDHIRDKNKESSRSGGSVTPGPEHSISATSVVNGNTISCNKVCEHRAVIAEEPQRCRRTDGKSWQCSNEAIPQQKYCESHMHRGSKRCKSSSEAETFNAISEVHFEPKNDRANLNTDLSISLVKCPQPTIVNLDSSTSGSSSDATTITDANDNSSSPILS